MCTYLEVLEYCRLLSLDLLRADALGEMAEQLVRVLLVHPAELRRPLRYLRKKCLELLYNKMSIDKVYNHWMNEFINIPALPFHKYTIKYTIIPSTRKMALRDVIRHTDDLR